MIQIGGSNIITVNGKSYSLPPGRNVSIINGRVLVDGKLFDECGELPRVTIEVNGDLLSLQADGSVSVQGSVQGDVRAGGSMNCGNVGGNATAGGSMNCGRVGGNASAGGSMNRG